MSDPGGDAPGAGQLGAEEPDPGPRDAAAQRAGGRGADPLPWRLRLIVVTDPELARPRSLLEVVREAVEAGAPAIQLRDKRASARELFEAGSEMLPIVREAGALFFVNDRVDVALALGADGVHVGPDDVPVAGVRRAVERAGSPTGAGRRGQGPAGGAAEGDDATRGGAEAVRSFYVGASADDPEVARRLVDDGADYIGCGTVYPTATKPDAGEVIGLEGLQRVAEGVDVPVVGIGGIDGERAAAVATRTGAAGVAVVGAVMGAADVGDAVRRLLARWVES